MSVNTGPARGMRDYLPEDVRRRQYVIGVIADVFQRYGFEPLETPAVENIETLLGKYGEEGDRLIFKILKRGEGAETGRADLALRYDLTVPLARVVAEYRAKLPKFFKRYQIQPVWRADRPQKGRFREFYQCDVDAIGSKSMVVESELLAAASDIFRGLGFNDFRIVINHRKLLNAVLLYAGVPVEQHGAALVIMDKVDKIGVDGVKKEFAEEGLAGETADQLAAMLGTMKDSSHLEQLSRVVNDEGQLAIRELREVMDLSEQTSARPHLELDGYLARGLSYYTGPIFEIRVPDLSGSLGGGGRYDNLIGMFLNDEVPACGISLGLERILVVMAERSMFPSTLTKAPAGAMVAVWNAASLGSSLKLAADLRAEGIAVELYPEADKLGKQFKYASSRGIPFVAIIGDEELANSTVAVKNMTTGEQVSVPRALAAQEILKRLANG